MLENEVVPLGEGLMAFKETIGGILILGVTACGIWFLIEKSVLTPTLFRDDANIAVERARNDALRAEAQRQQEAAARANAEAEAERIRRQQIDEENRHARQDAADRARVQAEADRIDQQRRDAENRRRQQQAEIEAQAAAQAAAIERARQAEAYRQANHGCNPGTHFQCFNCQTSNAPECQHIGGNGGCLCVRN
jgi:hypothetical protein